MQAWPRDPLDARERHGLDRPELGEVDHGNGRQRCAASRDRGDGARERRLDVLAGDAAVLASALDLVEVDVELARQSAYGGPGENAGEVRLRRPRRRGGSWSRGAAGAAGGGAGSAGGGAASTFAGAAAGAAAAPAPSASIRAMSVPMDTLSPTLVTTSATLPATVDGTSMVALSDSRVISD